MQRATFQERWGFPSNAKHSTILYIKVCSKRKGCSNVSDYCYQSSITRYGHGTFCNVDTEKAVGDDGDSIGTHVVDVYDDCKASVVSVGDAGKSIGIKEHALVNQNADFEPAEEGVGASENSCWKNYPLAKILCLLSELVNPPSIEDLICAFQACRNEKNKNCGKLLHTHVCKFGLEAHKIIGNHVAQLFAYCGSVFMANQVLRLLKDHNLCTWTSLMLGFIHCGQAHNAIILYEKMDEIGLHPSKHTLVTLLKACTRLKDLALGQQINSCIVQRGMEMDLFVRSTLIDIYGKCGLLVDAKKIFNMQGNRNTVLWSALIAAYAEHEYAEDAIICFERMQLEGISPDEVTYVSLLKSCGMLQNNERAFDIHSEIIEKGFERGRIIGNSLVELYAKSGSLAEATKVFSGVAVRDVVSWTSLITGYGEHGTNEELLLRFEEMQLEGVPPDAAVFTSLLKACTSIGDVKRGQLIHKLAREKQVDSDLFFSSTLMDMYVKHGFLPEAQEAFDKLPTRDVVSWNALLAGYAEHGPCEDVMSFFYQMQSEGVSQGPVTFLCALKACGNMGAVDMGQELHLACTLKGFENSLAVGSTLVDMYGKLGLLSEAWYAFHKLHAQDVVTWNVIINTHGINEAGDIALKLFVCMQEQGFKPDNATLTSLLTACSRSCFVQKGEELFKVLTKEHGVLATREHEACMVDFLARSGQVEEAWKVLGSLPCLPSGEGLRALLSACKTHTEQALGIACYKQLI